MRAAVLREQPGELHNESIGVALPKGQEVLVRVVASGLCHSDVHYMEGKFRLKLDEMLTARLSLDDVNDGYRALREGGVGRAVLVFDR